MNDIMTLPEAAEFLRVHPRTLRSWLNDDKVPAKKIGGVWRFSRALLTEYVEGRSRNPVEETVTTVVRRG